jgi:hypothetical protein
MGIWYMTVLQKIKIPMPEIPNSAVVVDYEMVFGQPASTTK